MTELYAGGKPGPALHRRNDDPGVRGIRRAGRRRRDHLRRHRGHRWAATAHVREALGALAELAGGAFADLDAARREAVVAAFRERGGAALATLSRVILQCYYRDDRVVRSLGLEPRPPFPKGHTLEQGDWSLLDPVRERPKMWRDAP